MQSGINKIKRLSNMNSDEGIQYFLHVSRFMVKKKNAHVGNVCSECPQKMTIENINHCGY